MTKESSKGRVKERTEYERARKTSINLNLKKLLLGKLHGSPSSASNGGKLYLGNSRGPSQRGGLPSQGENECQLHTDNGTSQLTEADKKWAKGPGTWPKSKRGAGHYPWSLKHTTGITHIQGERGKETVERTVGNRTAGRDHR